MPGSRDAASEDQERIAPRVSSRVVAGGWCTLVSTPTSGRRMVRAGWLQKLFCVIVGAARMVCSGSDRVREGGRPRKDMAVDLGKDIFPGDMGRTEYLISAEISGNDFNTRILEF